MKSSSVDSTSRNKNVCIDWDDADILIDLELGTEVDKPLKTNGKISKGTSCDQSSNTFILLDSDDDVDNNDNTNVQDDIHGDQQPIQDYSFPSLSDNDSFLASPKRFRSMSPTIHTRDKDDSDLTAQSTAATQPIHILLSPSPPPTRQYCDSSNKSTGWMSPFSPTEYDAGMTFSPSSTTLLFNEKTLTDANTISNDDVLLPSSPNRSSLDRFSMDADTLIISDNESIDSLPSTSELLSQMGQRSRTNKRHRHSENTTAITSNRKGKQVDTSYIPPSPSSSSISFSSLLPPSDQLWEWDDRFSSSSLRDTSKDFNHDSSQSTKKAVRAEQRKAEQEAKKQARAMAIARKEEEKAEALRLKEQAKQLQQVNRLRKDRSELVKEMTVVVLDTTFMQSGPGNLLQTVLEEKGAKIITKPMTSSSSTTFTLTWRMDCRAEWDDNEKQFIPFANGVTKCKEEQSALIFMTAERFINIIHQDRIETWINSIQQTAPTKQLFLMIEGLETFYKKKKSLMRRQFASTVLENMTTSNIQGNDDSNEANQRSRKRKQKDNAATLLVEGPSRDQIEDALTYLQVIKDVMLLQTLNEEDSVDWLVCLTTDLARANYNTINTAGLFKGQGGTIKSGVDAEDVWSKMLQEIQNCTPAVAKSVTQSYPNAMSLYQRYTQIGPDARDHLLANLEVERSVLSSRDRTINKFMSKKIHRIFMNDDPTDVIT